MNKAIFVLLAALAYGASAGEVLSGDAAKAKFPTAVQAMQLSETKWSQLMTGVEYGFTHAADMYGVPDDLHVLKIDYANAPVKMKILEHSPNKMRTSEAAAAANALFAINGTMYHTNIGLPVYNHKVDGKVITPSDPAKIPEKVHGLAFNPDKSFDFSSTATLEFDKWANVISCDGILHDGKNVMDPKAGYAWSTNAPSAGYPLIGMTPEKVLVILVIDGRRQGISVGINYHNAAELLKEFGCTEGILYDGGGSTTLAMRNDIVPDVGPDAKFATTQVVPDYCAGYTIMNYVNAGSSWVERDVIDQIAFVAEVPPPPNEFRVTPYVQHPAPTAMTLKFLTTTNTAATVYWWPEGNPGGVKSASVKPRLAEELQYYGDKHAKQYLHEMTPWQYRCRIEDLEPDTVYCYRVVLTDGETYEKSFRTAPAKNRSIRFVCYSDCETEPASNGSAVTWDNFAQDQDTNPSATSRKYFVDQTVGYASNICTMVSRKPDFFVIAGDLAQTGSCQTHWDEFWRHNAGALNDPAGSIPILAALGNHEYSSYSANAGGTAQPGEQGAKKFLSYFEFEPNGAAVDADQQQRFHRVDYGPVALIFIDPNNGPDNEPPAGTPWSWGWEYAHPHERDTNAQLYEHRIDGGVDKSSRVPQFQEGSAQYQWLEEQLADAQTNKLFTFLVCHQCPFSAGYHGRASGEKGRGGEEENLSGVPTRCLTNLVFKYGVDGWICGHDEMYEHSQVQGEETLPDGTKRPMTLNVWDVGIGGDGLRGCRIAENPNPYEVFRAHVDAPEVYDNGDWQTGTLVSGGKHYGHLEVDVELNDDGLWTAKLTPAYVFVSKNMQTGNLSFERRTYDDVVVVTNEQAGVQKVTVPTASAPEGKATVTLDASEALVGGVVNGTLADVADGYAASVFVGGRKVAVKDGAFSFVASDDPAQNQVTVSLVSDDAWYLAPSNRVDLKIASGVNTGYNPGDIMTTEDGASVFIAPSLSAYSGGKAGLVQYAADALYGMTSETPPTPVNGSFVAHGSASASVASFAVSAAAGFALNGSGYGDTTHGADEQDLRDDRDLSIVWPFGGQWGDAENFGAASDARVAMKTDMVKSMYKVYERMAPLVFSADGTKVYGNNYYQPEVYELAVTKEGETVKSILCTGKYWTLPSLATAMASASVNGEDVVFLSCYDGEFVSFKPSEGIVGNNDLTVRYVMLAPYRQLVVTGRADGNLHLIGNTKGGQIDVYAIAADGSGLASTEPLATANTSTALIKPIANGFTCRDDELGAVFNYRTDADVYVRTVSKAGYGALPEIDDPDQPDDPPSPPEEPEDETVIFVSPTGDGTAPHRSYETGYANIQTAIDAANDGDTILVGEGTYGFANPSDYWAVNVSNNVKIVATGARERTIIDCTKTGTLTNDQKNHRGGFYLTSEGAMISGFTVTNAYAMVKTWGPLCGATAGVVTNCYIHAPKSWLGASLGLSGTARGSEIELAPCTYTCSYYDGLYLVDLNNSAVLDRLKLVGATITYSQGNAFVRVMGDSVLRNSLIANNAVDIPSNANNGKFIQVEGKGRIESCTIADNTTNGGKGIVFVNSNTAVITNTVVWGNACNAGCLCEIYGGSGSGYGLNRFFGSCAAQLTDGVRDNLSSDPQFTDAANGDYEPKITSPVLDLAGTPDWAVVDAVGNARIVGEGMDLGAVECRTDKSKVPLSCTISRNVDKGATPFEVTFTASLAGKQDGIEFVWTFSDGATSTDGPSVKHTFAEPGAHTASVTVRNGSGETDSDTSDVVLALPKTCYVSTTGKNIAPYLNWENAATSVDAAVGLGTEEVVVGPGDYTLSAAECVVKAATFVHSSEGPEVTTIRANSAFGDRRAFSVINDAACVSGFTLTGGHAANYGYSSCLDVSAGVVSNCVIKGIANTSRSAVCYFSGTGSMVDCVIDGKGCTDGNPDGARALLNLNGNAHAERCVFSGLSFTANDIPHAAVILSGADTVLRNSLIHGCTNSTKVVSGTKYRYGGGIVIRADGGTVENCTVTDNYGTTDMGCGLAIEGSKGKVVNTIVWGNARKPAEGALNPQVYTQSADLATVCSYSCAPELTGGVGNVPDDPKIRTGNHRRFQLHGDSPCVNAGDNSVVPADDVDLLRFGRIYNVTVDMGCYECPAGGLMIRVR